MDVATSSPAVTVNIAAALPRLAQSAPDRIAMRCPGPDGRYGDAHALTYGALDTRSDAIAAGLAARGIVRGNLLMFAGLDSARTANLTVAAFDGVEPNTMRGVRVVFIGAAADSERVKAAVEPAGVEYVFVDTAQ